MPAAVGVGDQFVTVPLAGSGELLVRRPLARAGRGFQNSVWFAEQLVAGHVGGDRVTVAVPERGELLLDAFELQVQEGLRRDCCRRESG